MSTKARIGVQLTTGEIKSVLVWRDGHPDVLGTTLNDFYGTPEKAAALVERGNLLHVGQTLRRCSFERPEKGYDNPPRIYKTINAYRWDTEHDIRFKFIYRDGEWRYWEIGV